MKIYNYTYNIKQTQVKQLTINLLYKILNKYEMN